MRKLAYLAPLILLQLLALPAISANSKADKLKNECISLLKAKGLYGLRVNSARVTTRNGIPVTVKVVARYRALTGMDRHAVVTCANIDLAKGGRAIITEEDIGY
jgi:hypothetical protein